MDRAMLYRLAAGTGLRSSELASVTPKSFELTDDESVVNVVAAYSKRRRDDQQPMSEELAALYAIWLKDKPRGTRVFNMPPVYEVAEMLRKDLTAARAAWLARDHGPDREKREKSDFLRTPNVEGHLLDFHALRHCYISWLVNSGAPVSVCQELARHSTPMLTLGVYTHVQLADRSKALKSLPMPALPERFVKPRARRPRRRLRCRS